MTHRRGSFATSSPTHHRIHRHPQPTPPYPHTMDASGEGSRRPIGSGSLPSLQEILASSAGSSPTTSCVSHPHPLPSSLPPISAHLHGHRYHPYQGHQRNFSALPGSIPQTGVPANHAHPRHSSDPGTMVVSPSFRNRVSNLVITEEGVVAQTARSEVGARWLLPSLQELQHRQHRLRAESAVESGFHERAGDASMPGTPLMITGTSAPAPRTPVVLPLPVSTMTQDTEPFLRRRSPSTATEISSVFSGFAGAIRGRSVPESAPPAQTLYPQPPILTLQYPPGFSPQPIMVPQIVWTAFHPQAHQGAVVAQQQMVWRQRLAQVIDAFVHTSRYQMAMLVGRKQALDACRAEVGHARRKRKELEMTCHSMELRIEELERLLSDAGG